MDKYYYILTTLKKAKILGHNDINKKAKEEANKLIKNIGEKIEDQYVVKLKIKKVSKKLLKENEESKIKLIGGPIKIDIIFYQIENLKLKKLVNFPLNNNIYITEKYLSNHNITDSILKKITIITLNKKLNKKLFSINTIDKFCS